MPATRSSSSHDSTVPVGLLGEQTSIARVRGVTAFSSAVSGGRWKPSSARVRTGTTLRFAISA